jgi:hypothetical protein
MKTSTSFSKKAMTTAVLLLSSSVTFAASCCGGGSAGSLILPKTGKKVVDVSFDMEHYQGKWDANRKYIADPSADDLNQYRLNLGYGQRLASNWQAGIVVPYVWNDNQFSGETTQSEGLGDTSVSFWYEAFDRVTCVYQVNSIEDLKPAMYFGGSLTIPTGKSAYGDHVTDDYEITGRGFYRFDANFVIEKTIYPFTATVQGSYGKHFARPVNQEYGSPVEPYTKRLGDRKFLSAALGYTVFLEDLDTITVTTALAKLSEDEGRGAGTNSQAIEKQSVALTAAYASPDLTRVFKISWSHALASDGRGMNFPVTDIITLGFSYAFN